MNPEVYRHFSKVELKHWWFVSRSKLILSLLNRTHVPKGQGLDVGCGTGGGLKILEMYCNPVIGLDASSLAIDLAKEKYPKSEFVLGDANKLNNFFENNTFSLVTCLNVLYHDWIIDERSIVRQMNQILEKNGLIVLTEPAFNFLKRDHDKQVFGNRRYKINYFEQILEENGFEVLFRSYFNSISFIPALTLALLSKIAGSKTKINNDIVSEIKQPHIVINWLMNFAMTLERGLIALGVRLPIGVSLICIARKK